jgi:hypothetical protein
MNEGTINLRLTQPNGQASRFDVLAQIEPVGLNTPGAPRSFIVAADAAHGFDVDVEPGRYAVRLFLPGGGVLQGDCLVDPGGKVPLAFVEPVQRSQVFSLQEVIGSALLTDTLDEVIAARNPGPVATSSGKTTLIVKKTGTAPRTAPRARSVGRASAEKHAKVRLPAVSSPTLYTLDGQSADSLLDWNNLKDAGAAIEGLIATQRKQKPWRTREGAAIWRLHSESYATSARRFALVDTGSAYELAVLPMPWRCVRKGNFSVVDLAVDTTLGGRAATSIAVHDQALDALLSYLAPGQIRPLGAVMGILDAEGLIEQTIAEKAANPLAACAAAYAGLALFDASLQERWDSWLPNLMDRFPWLPDGAVVHARRMMLRPHSSDPSNALLGALRKAVSAGLPYYGVGLQLLRDMLHMLAVDHDEARLMLERVAPAAARLDPRQLFTVLRFPRQVP